MSTLIAPPTASGNPANRGTSATWTNARLTHHETAAGRHHRLRVEKMRALNALEAVRERPRRYAAASRTLKRVERHFVHLLWRELAPRVELLLKVLRGVVVRGAERCELLVEH
ncbi:MAG TPA: hypothetical protein VLX32_04725, partial [Candidatus Acidoferrum sp.]|nr:hypothetical protein [Candidatus Acidoferrum sp.]